MANWYEPTKEQLTLWTKWVAGRPECVRVVAKRFKPWILYRLKSSGHRVYLVSFSEDGTLTVAVTGEYNLIAFSRKVFGVMPDDLTECDLPSPDEVLGETVLKEDQDEYIENLKAKMAVRPASH